MQSGDLAGTLYRHTTMTPEETKALVDAHFLFRGADAMQASRGAVCDGGDLIRTCLL